MVTRVVELSPVCEPEDIRRALNDLEAAASDVVLVNVRDCGFQGVSEDVLQWLARLYGVVACISPTLEVLPLFESVGWSSDRVYALLDRLKGTATTLPEVAAAARDCWAASQQGTEPSGMPCVRFPRVAVGGTFDRLHAGHRLLLAATAITALKTVFVGVTADRLLANKKHAEKLQGYQEREARTVAFLSVTNPALDITTGPLSDPQEPTVAELDPTVDALVVSQETVPGAEAINRGRAARGFKQLEVVVVGLVGSGQEAKLSSTALRESEAAEATGAAQHEATRG